MSVSKAHILDRLRRVKGPDLDGNIVDLGLVSDILIKEDRVYFSITVPASRAEELEPLRASGREGRARGRRRGRRRRGADGREQARRRSGPSNVHEHPRVREASRSAAWPATAATAGWLHRRSCPAGMRQTQGVPGVKHI